jgi:antirestriction protein
MKTNPRIYVACLASYVEGKLYGTWIDANQSPDDIQEAIDAMLAKSPRANAEEWRIDDTKGFDPIKNTELCSVEEISDIANVLTEYGPEVVQAAMGHNTETSELLEWIQENYAGSFRTLEDWAEEFMSDTGQLNEIPENLRAYFDFEKWARDAELGGDVFTVEGGLGVHVFWNR